MKTLYHYIHFGLMGAGIGSIVTTLSLLLTGANGASMRELVVWLVTSFLIGIYTTVMYDERLPLPGATAIHFALTFVTVVGSCFFCGYGDGLLSIVKNMLPQFLIIYVVLYLVIFFSSKANEKAINESLSKN